jgi:glucosylceramidase
MNRSLLAGATLAGATLCLFACNQQTGDNSAQAPATPFSLEGKKALVFTTADSTALRLSPTDTLDFKDLAQPPETDVCVFVDPNHSFQTFLGIGGALTDASAETFAKLPKDKQQELMTAYYDPQKGIGYTLGRTSIHSCDFSSGSYTLHQAGHRSGRG